MNYLRTCVLGFVSLAWFLVSLPASWRLLSVSMSPSGRSKKLVPKFFGILCTNELPTHLRARFREVGASLLVSPHYWVLTSMSTMPPSDRSKKLVPEFLEGIIHDQNVRHQPLSSPRSRMGNYAALVKKCCTCRLHPKAYARGIERHKLKLLV